MNWRDHLTADEITQLAAIEAAKVEGQKQARRIYDRCRKRMARGESDREHALKEGSQS